MKVEYTAPAHLENAFHCPFCGVYAHQIWLTYIKGGEATKSAGYEIKHLKACRCSHCKQYSFWFATNIIYPTSSMASLPSPDMPANVAQDFKEAREVINASPRAAAALLRLAVQKLCKHLGQPGENTNDDIAALVKAGLSGKIQKALDTVRVVGNNAVHPGHMDLRDDQETALKLFKLINIIIDAMITQPKEVDELFDKLPESAREGIKKRDKKS